MICVFLSFFFLEENIFMQFSVLSLLIIVQSHNSGDCNVYINNAFAEKNYINAFLNTQLSSYLMPQSISNREQI